jgi:hypothetical protein
LLPWALFCRKLLDIVGLFTALQLPAILTLSLPFYILGLQTEKKKKNEEKLPIPALYNLSYFWVLMI